jgi:hypothetical protein
MLGLIGVRNQHGVCVELIIVKGFTDVQGLIYLFRVIRLIMVLFLPFKRLRRLAYYWRKDCLVKISSLCKHLRGEVELLAFLPSFRLLKYLQGSGCPHVETLLNRVQIATDLKRIHSLLKSFLWRFYFICESFHKGFFLYLYLSLFYLACRGLRRRRARL